MEKKCLWCSQTKSKEEFAGRWGRSKYCKVCYPLWHKENDRQVHATPESLERARVRRNERYATEPAFAEERKQRAHAYRQTHPEWTAAKKREWQQANPEKVRESVRRSRQRHPERSAAREAVQAAIAKGWLTPQPCWCGKLRVDAHHHNGYATEHIFDVVWLCRKHHAEQHRKYPREA